MVNISNQRKDEICSAFQRSIKHGSSEETESISLEELQQADVKLRKRDIKASYRRAMKKRIEKLETEKSLKEQREHDSKIRVRKWAMSILIGLVIAGVAKLLFG